MLKTLAQFVSSQGENDCRPSAGAGGPEGPGPGAAGREVISGQFQSQASTISVQIPIVVARTVVKLRLIPNFWLLF